MPEYVTHLVWKGDQKIELSANEKPVLTLTPPQEFGGSEMEWSPEELMTGALDSCLLFTTLYLVKRLKIDLVSYQSHTTMKMERLVDGLRIQSISLNIEAAVRHTEDIDKMKSAVEKAETYCPINGALKCCAKVKLNVSATG